MVSTAMITVIWLTAFLPTLLQSKWIDVLTLGGTDNSYKNETINVGKEYFNAVFGGLCTSSICNTPIIRRQCDSCNGGSKDIYYKRLTAPHEFDAYSNMLLWTNTSNVLGTDFNLFSTLQDALTDNNAWPFCNFNDFATKVGAFRDCTNNTDATKRNGNQWTGNHTTPPGQSVLFSVYVPDTDLFVIPNIELNYIDAQSFCKQLYNESLADIYDPAENRAILQMVNANSLTEGALIGYHRNGSDWQWQSGKGYDPLLWVNSPLSAVDGNVETPQTQCFRVSRFGWIYERCHNSSYFVCQTKNHLPQFIDSESGAFKLSTDRRLKFDDARSLCRAQYFDLATIYEQEEYDVAKNLCAVHADNESNCWIGLEKGVLNVNEWEWVQDLPISVVATNRLINIDLWAPFQPFQVDSAEVRCQAANNLTIEYSHDGIDGWSNHGPYPYIPIDAVPYTAEDVIYGSLLHFTVDTPPQDLPGLICTIRFENATYITGSTQFLYWSIIKITDDIANATYSIVEANSVFATGSTPSGIATDAEWIWNQHYSAKEAVTVKDKVTFQFAFAHTSNVQLRPGDNCASISYTPPNKWKTSNCEDSLNFICNAIDHAPQFATSSEDEPKFALLKDRQLKRTESKTLCDQLYGYGLATIYSYHELEQVMDLMTEQNIDKAFIGLYYDADTFVNTNNLVGNHFGWDDQTDFIFDDWTKTVWKDGHAFPTPTAQANNSCVQQTVNATTNVTKWQLADCDSRSYAVCNYRRHEPSWTSSQLGAFSLLDDQVQSYSRGEQMCRDWISLSSTGAIIYHPIENERALWLCSNATNGEGCFIGYNNIPLPGRTATDFRWRNGAKIDVFKYPWFGNPFFNVSNDTTELVTEGIEKYLTTKFGGNSSTESHCTAIMQDPVSKKWAWDIVSCDKKLNMLCDSGADHAQCWMLRTCAECAVRRDCGWCGDGSTISTTGHCQLKEEICYLEPFEMILQEFACPDYNPVVDASFSENVRYEYLIDIETCSNTVNQTVPTEDLVQDQYVNLSRCVLQTELIELYISADSYAAETQTYDIYGRVLELNQSTTSGDFSNFTSFRDHPTCDIKVRHGWVPRITCNREGAGARQNVTQFDMLHDVLRYLLPRLESRLFEGFDVAQNNLWGYTTMERHYDEDETATEHNVRSSFTKQQIIDQRYEESTTDLLLNAQHNIDKNNSNINHMNMTLIHVFTNIPHHNGSTPIKLFTRSQYTLNLLHSSDSNTTYIQQLNTNLYRNITALHTKNYTFDEWRGIRRGDFIYHFEDPEENRRRLGSVTDALQKFCKVYNNYTSGGGEMHFSIFGLELWVSQIIEAVKEGKTWLEIIEIAAQTYLEGQTGIQTDYIQPEPMTLVPDILELDLGFKLGFGFAWDFEPASDEAAAEPSTERRRLAANTSDPTHSPTKSPTTSEPSKSPTKSPTTAEPTKSPTKSPISTATPTQSPVSTVTPTESPTTSPSTAPTAAEDSGGDEETTKMTPCPLTFRIVDRLKHNLVTAQTRKKIITCCDKFQETQQECDKTYKDALKAGNACLKEEGIWDEIYKIAFVTEMTGLPVYTWNENYSPPSLLPIIKLVMFFVDADWDATKKNITEMWNSIESGDLSEAATAAKDTQIGTMLSDIKGVASALSSAVDQAFYLRNKGKKCKRKGSVPFGITFDIEFNFGPKLGKHGLKDMCADIGLVNKYTRRRQMLSGGASVQYPIIPEIELPCIPLYPPLIMLCPSLEVTTDFTLDVEPGIDADGIDLEMTPRLSFDVTAGLSLSVGVEIVSAQIELGVQVSFIGISFPFKIGVQLTDFGLFGDIGMDITVLQLTIFLKFKICLDLLFFTTCPLDVTLWSFSITALEENMNFATWGMGSYAAQSTLPANADDAVTKIRFYWAFKDSLTKYEGQYHYEWQESQFEVFKNVDVWIDDIFEISACQLKPGASWVNMTWINDTSTSTRNNIRSITEPYACKYNVYDPTDEDKQFDKLAIFDVYISWYSDLGMTTCFQSRVRPMFEESLCCDFAVLVYDEIEKKTHIDFEIASYKMIVQDVHTPPNWSDECAQFWLDTDVLIDSTPWYDDCNTEGWLIGKTIDAVYQFGYHPTYLDNTLTHYNRHSTCLNWYNASKAVKTKRTFQIEFPYDFLMIGLRIWTSITDAHLASDYYEVKIFNQSNTYFLNNVNAAGNATQSAYSRWYSVTIDYESEGVPKAAYDYKYTDVVIYIDPLLNADKKYKFDLEITANIQVGEFWGFSHLVMNTFTNEEICVNGINPVVELSSSYIPLDSLIYTYYGLRDVPSLYYGYLLFDISFDYRFYDKSALISLSPPTTGDDDITTPHWLINFDTQQSGLWIRYGTGRLPADSDGVLTLDSRLAQVITDTTEQAFDAETQQFLPVYTSMYIQWNAAADSNFMRVGFGHVLGEDVIASVKYDQFGLVASTDTMIKYVGFAQSVGSSDLGEVNWKIYTNDKPSYCLSTTELVKMHETKNYKQVCVENQHGSEHLIVYDLVTPDCIYYTGNTANTLPYTFTIPAAHDYVQMSVDLFADFANVSSSGSCLADDTVSVYYAADGGHYSFVTNTSAAGQSTATFYFPEMSHLSRLRFKVTNVELSPAYLYCALNINDKTYYTSNDEQFWRIIQAEKGGTTITYDPPSHHIWNGDQGNSTAYSVVFEFSFLNVFGMEYIQISIENQLKVNGVDVVPKWAPNLDRTKCTAVSYFDSISSEHGVHTTCHASFNATFAHQSTDQTFTISFTPNGSIPYGIADIQLQHGLCFDVLPLTYDAITYNASYTYWSSSQLPSISAGYVFGMMQAEMDEYESSETFISIGTKSEAEPRFIVRIWSNHVAVYASTGDSNAFPTGSQLANYSASISTPLINNQDWFHFYIEWDADVGYFRMGTGDILGATDTMLFHIDFYALFNLDGVVIDTVGVMHANAQNVPDWNVIEVEWATTNEDKICWTTELENIAVKAWSNTELNAKWFTEANKATLRIPSAMLSNSIFNGPFTADDIISKPLTTIFEHDYIHITGRVYGIGAWDVVYPTWLNEFNIFFNESETRQSLVWFGTFLNNGGVTGQACNIEEYKEWFSWTVPASTSGVPLEILSHDVCTYDVDIYLLHTSTNDPFAITFDGNLQQTPCNDVPQFDIQIVDKGSIDTTIGQPKSLSSNHYGACKYLCEQEEECQSWMYNVSGHCWLKSTSDVYIVRKGGYVSGICDGPNVFDLNTSCKADTLEKPGYRTADLGNNLAVLPVETLVNISIDCQAETNIQISSTLNGSTWTNATPLAQHNTLEISDQTKTSQIRLDVTNIGLAQNDVGSVYYGIESTAKQYFFVHHCKSNVYLSNFSRTVNRSIPSYQFQVVQPGLTGEDGTISLKSTMIDGGGAKKESYITINNDASNTEIEPSRLTFPVSQNGDQLTEETTIVCRARNRLTIEFAANGVNFTRVTIPGIHQWPDIITVQVNKTNTSSKVRFHVSSFFEPTEQPTTAPTADTAAPTISPTAPTTAIPTISPTAPTTALPTVSPTAPTTAIPTTSPTAPTTAIPTTSPTSPTTPAPTTPAPTTPGPTTSPTAPTTATPTSQAIPSRSAVGLRCSVFSALFQVDTRNDSQHWSVWNASNPTEQYGMLQTAAAVQATGITSNAYWIWPDLNYADAMFEFSFANVPSYSYEMSTFKLSPCTEANQSDSYSIQGVRDYANRYFVANGNNLPAANTAACKGQDIVLSVNATQQPSCFNLRNANPAGLGCKISLSNHEEKTFTTNTNVTYWSSSSALVPVTTDSHYTSQLNLTQYGGEWIWNEPCTPINATECIMKYQASFTFSLWDLVAYPTTDEGSAWCKQVCLAMENDECDGWVYHSQNDTLRNNAQCYLKSDLPVDLIAAASYVTGLNIQSNQCDCICGDCYPGNLYSYIYIEDQAHFATPLYDLQTLYSEACDYKMALDESTGNYLIKDTKTYNLINTISATDLADKAAQFSYPGVRMILNGPVLIVTDETMSSDNTIVYQQRCTIFPDSPATKYAANQSTSLGQFYVSYRGFSVQFIIDIPSTMSAKPMQILAIGDSTTFFAFGWNDKNETYILLDDTYYNITKDYVKVLQSGVTSYTIRVNSTKLQIWAMQRQAGKGGYQAWTLSSSVSDGVPRNSSVNSTAYDVYIAAPWRLPAPPVPTSLINIQAFCVSQLPFEEYTSNTDEFDYNMRCWSGKYQHINRRDSFIASFVSDSGCASGVSSCSTSFGEDINYLPYYDMLFEVQPSDDGDASCFAGEFADYQSPPIENNLCVMLKKCVSPNPMLYTKSWAMSSVNVSIGSCSETVSNITRKISVEWYNEFDVNYGDVSVTADEVYTINKGFVIFELRPIRFPEQGFGTNRSVYISLMNINDSVFGQEQSNLTWTFELNNEFGLKFYRGDRNGTERLIAAQYVEQILSPQEAFAKGHCIADGSVTVWFAADGNDDNFETVASAKHLGNETVFTLDGVNFASKLKLVVNGADSQSEKGGAIACTITVNGEMYHTSSSAQFWKVIHASGGGKTVIEREPVDEWVTQLEASDGVSSDAKWIWHYDCDATDTNCKQSEIAFEFSFQNVYNPDNAPSFYIEWDADHGDYVRFGIYNQTQSGLSYTGNKNLLLETGYIANIYSHDIYYDGDWGYHRKIYLQDMMFSIANISENLDYFVYINIVNSTAPAACFQYNLLADNETRITSHTVETFGLWRDDGRAMSWKLNGNELPGWHTITYFNLTSNATKNRVDMFPYYFHYPFVSEQETWQRTFVIDDEIEHDYVEIEFDFYSFCGWDPDTDLVSVWLSFAEYLQFDKAFWTSTHTTSSCDGYGNPGWQSATDLIRMNNGTKQDLSCYAKEMESPSYECTAYLNTIEQSQEEHIDFHFNCTTHEADDKLTIVYTDGQSWMTTHHVHTAQDTYTNANRYSRMKVNVTRTQPNVGKSGVKCNITVGAKQFYTNLTTESWTVMSADNGNLDITRTNDSYVDSALSPQIFIWNNHTAGQPESEWVLFEFHFYDAFIEELNNSYVNTPKINISNTTNITSIVFEATPLTQCRFRFSEDDINQTDIDLRDSQSMSSSNDAQLDQYLFNSKIDALYIARQNFSYQCRLDIYSECDFEGSMYRIDQSTMNTTKLANAASWQFYAERGYECMATLSNSQKNVSVYLNVEDGGMMSDLCSNDLNITGFDSVTITPSKVFYGCYTHVRFQAPSAQSHPFVLRLRADIDDIRTKSASYSKSWGFGNVTVNPLSCAKASNIIPLRTPTKLSSTSSKARIYSEQLLSLQYQYLYLLVTKNNDLRLQFGGVSGIQWSIHMNASQCILHHLRLDHTVDCSNIYYYSNFVDADNTDLPRIVWISWDPYGHDSDASFFSFGVGSTLNTDIIASAPMYSTSSSTKNSIPADMEYVDLLPPAEGETIVSVVQLSTPKICLSQLAALTLDTGDLWSDDCTETGWELREAAVRIFDDDDTIEYDETDDSTLQTCKVTNLNDNSVTQRLKNSCFHGPFQGTSDVQRGDYVTRYFFVLPDVDYDIIYVELDYLSLCTWNPEKYERDTAYVYVNEHALWRSAPKYEFVDEYCQGEGLYPDWTLFTDYALTLNSDSIKCLDLLNQICKYHVSLTFPFSELSNNAPYFHLGITAKLNQAITNEAFGFTNVTLSYGSCADIQPIPIRELTALSLPSSKFTVNFSNGDMFYIGSALTYYLIVTATNYDMGRTSYLSEYDELSTGCTFTLYGGYKMWSQHSSDCTVDGLSIMQSPRPTANYELQLAGDGMLSLVQITTGGGEIIEWQRRTTCDDDDAYYYYTVPKAASMIYPYSTTIYSLDCSWAAKIVRSGPIEIYDQGHKVASFGTLVSNVTFTENGALIIADDGEMKTLAPKGGDYVIFDSGTLAVIDRSAFTITAQFDFNPANCTLDTNIGSKAKYFYFMRPGDVLWNDEYLISPNCEYKLALKDGALRIYNGSNDLIWHEPANGELAGKFEFLLDGNAVLYSYEDESEILWQSNSSVLFEQTSIFIADHLLLSDQGAMTIIDNATFTVHFDSTGHIAIGEASPLKVEYERNLECSYSTISNASKYEYIDKRYGFMATWISYYNCLDNAAKQNGSNIVNAPCIAMAYCEAVEQYHNVFLLPSSSALSSCRQYQTGNRRALKNNYLLFEVSIANVEPTTISAINPSVHLILSTSKDMAFGNEFPVTHLPYRTLTISISVKNRTMTLRSQYNQNAPPLNVKGLFSNSTERVEWFWIEWSANFDTITIGNSRYINNRSVVATLNYSDYFTEQLRPGELLFDYMNFAYNGVGDCSGQVIVQLPPLDVETPRGCYEYERNHKAFEHPQLYSYAYFGGSYETTSDGEEVESTSVVFESTEMTDEDDDDQGEDESKAGASPGLIAGLSVLGAAALGGAGFAGYRWKTKTKESSDNDVAGAVELAERGGQNAEAEAQTNETQENEAVDGAENA